MDQVHGRSGRTGEAAVRTEQSLGFCRHGQDMQAGRSGRPGRSQRDFQSVQAGGTEDMRFSRADLSQMNVMLIAAAVR